jgi:DNA-directed RNA polymerase subunit RPC12/RpoP
MEILIRGTSPKEKTYDGTCLTCRTTVRFLAVEGKVTRDQRDGDYISVVCPVCGGKIHSAL